MQAAEGVEAGGRGGLGQRRRRRRRGAAAPVVRSLALRRATKGGRERRAWAVEARRRREGSHTAKRHEGERTAARGETATPEAGRTLLLLLLLLSETAERLLVLRAELAAHVDQHIRRAEDGKALGVRLGVVILAVIDQVEDGGHRMLRGTRGDPLAGGFMRRRRRQRKR